MPTPDDDALSAFVRHHATRHAPPAGLADRITAGVRMAPTEHARAAAPTRRRWLESLALFGAGAAAMWLASSSLLVTAPLMPTADDVAASHVRALMAAHLTDVVSSDRHTVKPWFAGRLDYSPPVHDLADAGFMLAGARLDTVAGRTVAALVYRHGLHVLTLFVWPAGARPDTSVQQRRGYNLRAWSQAGMQLWAVSDAGADELQRFASALGARIASPSPP